MVNRNQNVDDIIHNVGHDDVAANNTLASIVERIMVQNGVNFGLRRPNYTSPFSEYILQAEAPLRTKIPKFTKFAGDTTESTVEHVVRYLIEVGDMSNNESFRIKKFQVLSQRMLSHGSRPCPKIRSTLGTNWKECSINSFTWGKRR